MGKREYNEARARANKKYNTSHYWRFGTSVPKELEKQIRTRATETCGSMNNYILTLIKKDLGIENEK